MKKITCKQQGLGGCCISLAVASLFFSFCFLTFDFLHVTDLILRTYFVSTLNCFLLFLFCFFRDFPTKIFEVGVIKINKHLYGINKGGLYYVANFINYLWSKL